MIAPVVIIATLGVIETTKVVRAKSLLTAAVANMVEMVAIESGAPPLTRLGLQDYCKAAQLTMQPFVTTGLAISVASVTNRKTPLPAGPATDWEYNASCPTTAPALGTIGARDLAASMVPNVGDSVIVAVGSYRYVPLAVISPFTFANGVRTPAIQLSSLSGLLMLCTRRSQWGGFKRPV